MNSLAIDIGGSVIKAGYFEDDCLLLQKEFENNGKRGASFLIRRVLEIISHFLKSCPASAIGLSITGQIDPVSGTVLFATDAIPGFTGKPIRRIVSEATSLPITIGNDVNCAALGESVFGAGKDYKDFFCLTYGTGVGMGIILNNHIWTGLNGVAGEVGHMTIHAGQKDCVCGRKGCYEAYASTTALIDRIQDRIGVRMTGRQIFSHFEEKKYREEIDFWIDEIAEGLISLLHIFGPPAILLGGGIMQQDYVFMEVKRRTLERVLPTFKNTVIRRASLGNWAGIYGAYVLTTQKNPYGINKSGAEN